MINDLHLGDCREILLTLEENSIDTCITDPPYELGFMGKDWDSAGVSFQKETWEAVYRVLKPGAFLLAFGGTRTSHRIAVAIEDAGFEIRDTICWLYGQGFPKSYNIGKGIDKKAGKEREVVGKNPNARPNSDNRGEGVYGGGKGSDHSPNLTAPATSEAELWDGWGTGLKPAFEPIIVAMKPIDGTYVENALKHGVSGLWIDGGRIGTSDNDKEEMLKMSKGFEGKDFGRPEIMNYGYEESMPKKTVSIPHDDGRWPANVVLDEEAAEMLDEQTGIQKGGFVRNRTDGARPFENDGKDTGYETVAKIDEPDGGASRFFYCAKASKKERNMGLEDLDDQIRHPSGNNQGTRVCHDCGKTDNGSNDHSKCGGKYEYKLCAPIKNSHPTVKPLALMQYLVRLTKTPTGGIVIDPFMGSGTTGMACVLEIRDFIGIDTDEEYYEIAGKRIKAVQKTQTQTQIKMDI